MNFEIRLTEALARLRQGGNLRMLPQVPDSVINLSSNDYLGLLTDEALLDAFYAQLPRASRRLSAASSRLLTGNVPEAIAFEDALCQAYGSEAALVFDSGYHANTGILPALVGKKSLVLADKLCHASMIDGIRASGCTFYRYRHNDLGHARTLLERYASIYDEVFIMTESVFSMDGDRVDIPQLVALKRAFPNVVLYLDEAHGVGVFGETGLGCAHATGLHQEIDLLVGTLGKAWSSMGAYLICSQVVRNTLINRMRPFIFTTALPPINLAWSRFVLETLPSLQARRERLLVMGERLAETIRQQGTVCVSASQIVPYVIGENIKAMALAKRFREAGFYVLPIRPPTVPEGTARLRFSLTAAVPDVAFERLLELVQA